MYCIILIQINNNETSKEIDGKMQENLPCFQFPINQEATQQYKKHHLLLILVMDWWSIIIESLLVWAVELMIKLKGKAHN